MVSLVEFVFMFSGICHCAQKERIVLGGIGYEGTVKIRMGDAIMDRIRTLLKAL